MYQRAATHSAYIGDLMDPLQIVVILAALLLVATLVGFVWQNGQGRVSRHKASSLPPDVPLEFVDQSTRFTLLQFSGPFCSYCDAMRGVLQRAAAAHPGVVSHREIDITDHLELTRALRVSQTPTTFIVTATGHLVSRISGAAKPPVVEAEIQNALTSRKAASDEYLI
jgi:thiol-disulfide isomerase/thioredoxin